MSLVSFVRLKDVVARLKPFRPQVHSHEGRLRVRHVGNTPQLLGTAFDYLLRFELQRLAPHAVHREWIAEIVPHIICQAGSVPGTWVARDFLLGKGDDGYLPPVELSNRVADICRMARVTLAEYLRDPDPCLASRRELAAWAIRLGKLDGLYRRGDMDPTFAEAPDELVDELVELLAEVPFPRLVHPDTMLLNPDFGEVSRLVGGADADLITGDLLADFKTTKSAEVKGEDLDQLLGYFLLARRAGLPEIRRVGLYFSRFGHLRTGHTDMWTSRADFDEMERWFFERALEVFGTRGG